MKVAVIGSNGVVGSALVKTLRFIDHEVMCNDITDENSDTLDKIKAEAEVIFLCLPTPMSEDGSVNLDYLHTVLQQLVGYNGVVVVKSTVVPGTCGMFAAKYGLRIVHNPEFLTAKNADFDSIMANKHILGGDGRDTRIVSRVYRQFHKREDIQEYHFSLECAEMCKYASNIFLAMKVSFANELYEICNFLGIDYRSVVVTLLKDDRIADYGFHISPERGWGGMCFPKDLSAFRAFCKEHNIPFDMLNATWDVNERVKK